MKNVGLLKGGSIGILGAPESLFASTKLEKNRKYSKNTFDTSLGILLELNTTFTKTH
jgi:hypothetical protein